MTTIRKRGASESVVSNPYESPLPAKDVGTGIEKSGSLLREGCVLALAAFTFFVLGPLASFLVSRLVVGGQIAMSETALAVVYWFAWGGRIIGRFCVDFLAGVLMGRYLQRLKPQLVLFVFISVALAVIVGTRGFLDVDDGWWLRSVGLVGCIFQQCVQVLMMFLAVSCGMWTGQRSGKHSQE